jgi:hypothetical protein
MARGGFELYETRSDGSRGSTILRGDIQAVAAQLRSLSLRPVKDPSHPLGVYYVSPTKGVFVVDFFLER